MIEKLSLYRSFLAAAAEGSISAGARALFVSQPALSADIHALEEALGVKLFFRASRGITLTPEGELLEGYVRPAFSLLDVGEERLRDIAGLHGGSLRIGASDMTLRFFLLDHIGAFAPLPEVRLSVTNNPTPETLRALRAGKNRLRRGQRAARRGLRGYALHSGATFTRYFRLRPLAIRWPDRPVSPPSSWGAKR